MRALFCAISIALPIACAVPSLASAQRVEPYRGDPRGVRPPPWLGADEASDSAAALASRATRLSRVVQRIEGYSELADRTQGFAQEATRLARAIDSGARYAELMASFDRLQREYVDLRGAFFAEHRTHHIEGVVDDWTALVSGFERLSLELGVEESRLCTLEGHGRYGRGYRGGRYDDRFDERYDDRFGERYDRYDPRYDRVPG